MGTWMTAPMLAPVAFAQQGAQTTASESSSAADAPLSIASDSLTFDETSGATVLEGGVTITQGALQIEAPRMELFYLQQTGEIRRITATGGITMQTETGSITAQQAEYLVESGTITARGDVVLRNKQGDRLTAAQLVYDLTSGEVQLQGGVRTLLRQGDRPQQSTDE